MDDIYAFQKGKGVEKNMDETLKWWTMAADQGDSEFQYALGSLYKVGRRRSRECGVSEEEVNRSSNNGLRLERQRIHK